jgi:LDH2 family malate/lactate/ureidoglycolate dehydrogenase
VAQVAPWGGRTGELGTNPFCIAVPGGEQGDVILDMATTVVARGKVQLAELEGKPIPLGWAVDKDGNPTTDPAAVRLGGRMLPVGGPKGYGLALMVEIFSSLLSGAALGREIGSLYGNLDVPQQMGHFFGAIKIANFQPPAAFRARMDLLTSYMKSSKLAPGYSEIFMPGEPERRKAAEYRRDGIPIEEDVIGTMNKLAASLGVRPLGVRPS